MHNRLKTEGRCAKNKRITEQLERAFKTIFFENYYVKIYRKWNVSSAKMK